MSAEKTSTTNKARAQGHWHAGRRRHTHGNKVPLDGQQAVDRLEERNGDGGGGWAPGRRIPHEHACHHSCRSASEARVCVGVVDVWMCP